MRLHASLICIVHCCYMHFFKITILDFLCNKIKLEIQNYDFFLGFSDFFEFLIVMLLYVVVVRLELFEKLILS